MCFSGCAPSCWVRLECCCSKDGAHRQRVQRLGAQCHGVGAAERGDAGAVRRALLAAAAVCGDGVLRGGTRCD